MVDDIAMMHADGTECSRFGLNSLDVASAPQYDNMTWAAAIQTFRGRATQEPE